MKESKLINIILILERAKNNLESIISVYRITDSVVFEKVSTINNQINELKEIIRSLK